MKKSNTLFLTQAAAIAALYVILNLYANFFTQVRISEALTILPYFTPAAIPGLFIGCFLSNFLSGCMPQDIIFGSLATLVGAYGTYKLRFCKWLAPIPPIIANSIVVPLLFIYVYGMEGTYLYFMGMIGIGELLSCGGLGMLLLFALEKYKKYIFRQALN